MDQDPVVLRAQMFDIVSCFMPESIMPESIMRDGLFGVAPDAWIVEFLFITRLRAPKVAMGTLTRRLVSEQICEFDQSNCRNCVMCIQLVRTQ